LYGCSALGFCRYILSAVVYVSFICLSFYPPIFRKLFSILLFSFIASAFIVIIKGQPSRRKMSANPSSQKPDVNNFQHHPKYYLEGADLHIIVSHLQGLASHTSRRIVLFSRSTTYYFVFIATFLSGSRSFFINGFILQPQVQLGKALRIRILSNSIM